MAALPHTRLVGATLARVESKPCTRGSEFGALVNDESFVSEGPLELGGRHELELVFPRRLGEDEPLRRPSAVDLALEAPGWRGCVRVPLGAFEPEATSTGYLVGVGGRAFPISTTNRTGVVPIGAALVRMGGVNEQGRLFGEVWGGGDAHQHSGYLGLGLAGDRPLWARGRWGLTYGLAYEAVLTYRLHDDQSSSLEYVLHGPRITPALSFAPLSPDSRYAGFPLGRRTALLELEVPVSGWFGTRGAPAFTLVVGMGLDFTFAF